jgi:YhcG PDDEXK nuclease domain
MFGEIVLMKTNYPDFFHGQLSFGRLFSYFFSKPYLAVLDDTVRLPDENPAIGIILCKTKDRTIVEYALRESNKPIGVTTYQIVSTLPQEFQGQLPDPTQIAQLLGGID